MPALDSIATRKARELQPPPAAGRPYSLPIPGSKVDGRSHVYRHWRFRDQPLLETLDPQIRTVHDAFTSAAKAVPKNNCLGLRPWDRKTRSFGDYVWEDYATVDARRLRFGVGVSILHERIGKTEKKYGVGIWAANRPEWQITDLGCMSQGLYTVSLYDTLGPEACEYIINHAELTCVVTALKFIPTLINLAPKCPTLKIIVSMDPLDEGDIPQQSKGALLQSFAKNAGIQLHYFGDVEALGAAEPRSVNPPLPEDLITINYTSGTTGDPKGVVLTHANAIAGASSGMIFMNQTENDVGLSFLPLAHIFQRVGEHIALWGGAGLAYFHGNINEILEDLKLVRPTGFSGVPRLYNRIGSGIKAQTIEHPRYSRKALSERVIKTKLGYLNDPRPGKATNKHFLWDRIWSRRVAAQVGLERVHTMVSGSAPLDRGLHQLMRIVFCDANVCQGYGLTETYAITLCQMVGDLTSGNCGAVMPGTELCLRDVPDMDYLTTDQPQPRGELYIRGKTNFREYWKNPEATAKSVDADGWFATGDICTVDSMGRFAVIDRVKNVLKLSQGEYVSPEKIENVFLGNLGYLQAGFVHGDSEKSSLIGIFGVEPEHFATLIGRVTGVKTDQHDVAALKAACLNPLIQKHIHDDLQRVAKENKFNKYEYCRAAKVYVDPFTHDNNLLTPTMKLRRSQTAKHYRPVLDELYAIVDAEDAAKPQRALL